MHRPSHGLDSAKRWHADLHAPPGRAGGQLLQGKTHGRGRDLPGQGLALLGRCPLPSRAGPVLRADSSSCCHGPRLALPTTGPARPRQERLVPDHGVHRRRTRKTPPGAAGGGLALLVGHPGLTSGWYRRGLTLPATPGGRAASGEGRQRRLTPWQHRADRPLDTLAQAARSRQHRAAVWRSLRLTCSAA